MTARQIVPDSGRRPLSAAVALVLLLAMAVVAAGCAGGYLLDQDLAVIKIKQDGTIAWMKIIDSGKDDSLADIIETSDGGYAVAGGYSNSNCAIYSHLPSTLQVTRLSDTGEIIWVKDLKSEITGIPGIYDQISGIVQKPDTGYYLVTRRGSVLDLSPSGSISSIRVHDTDDLNRTEVNTIFRTRDGGSVIAGFTFQCEFKDRIECPGDKRHFQAFIEKLDPYGNSSWIKTYDDKDFFIARMVIELNDDRGYVSVMESLPDKALKDPVNESLVILDTKGIIRNSTGIGPMKNIYKIQPKSDGFIVYSINRDSNFTYKNDYYDNDGIMIGSVSFSNTKTELMIQDLNSSTGITSTAYLNLKPAEISQTGRPKTNVTFSKITEQGNVIWVHQIGPFPTDASHIQFGNLMETSDKGYLAVLGIEKVQMCYQ